MWRVFKTGAGGGRASPERAPPTASGSVETHVELLDGRSATLVGGDDLHLHDLDGVGASTMASSHVTV